MATRKTASAPAKKAAPAKKTAADRRASVVDNEWAGVQLPAGFTVITNGEYGQEWDYERAPVLLGTIAGAVREIEVKRGKTLEMQKVVTVKGTVASKDGEIAGDGVFTVWDSGALHEWFNQVQPGMSVAVVFKGYRDTGKGSPMKDFNGLIRDDEVPTLEDKAEREDFESAPPRSAKSTPIDRKPKPRANGRARA